MALDRFDLALLDALQHDCRRTADDLGANIGLSATAVQRRIRRLKERGASTAEAAVLGPAEVMPSRLLVVAEIALKQGRGAAVDSFKREMQAHAEVQQCYYVAGDHDFMLIVVAQDMADYERFTREVFFPNDNIARFRSTMVMDTVKASLRLPLHRLAPSA